MGFRWRKSKSLGKFLRLNVTKNGVGFSLGPRTGLGRLNISPTGRRSVSAGIPGTGLSYNKRIGEPQTTTEAPSRQAQQLTALEHSWATITPDVLPEFKHLWATDPDGTLATYLTNMPTFDPDVVREFLESKLGPDGPAPALGTAPSTEAAGEFSRDGVRAALAAAGLRLATDDEAGFGVRDPDDKGVIRAFWVNGQRSEREEQVPFGAAALRHAGYNARVIRLDGSYPGIIVKPPG